MTRSRRQIRIDRLELDLRGMSPEAARAAVAKLGPALVQALRAQSSFRPDAHGSAARIDAGRLEPGAATDPGSLADAIAGRIAGALTGPQTRMKGHRP